MKPCARCSSPTEGICAEVQPVGSRRRRPGPFVAQDLLAQDLLAQDLLAQDLLAQDLQTQDLITRTVQAPFDLAAGPLIRGCLVRLTEQEHVLCVAMHHIISDGWSIGVAIKELAALYGALVAGRADPLPVLEIQYADYAQWQRQWLTGPALQQQLDYWKHHLAGAPALLELPTDRPRPSARSHAGASVDFVVDAPLCADLKALARRHGATLYMVLYSAWAILLSRLSGQDDIVIGSPIAGRQRTELEGLIGFFINTLALRVDLSADPTVDALIAQVKEITLSAYGHQDIPFEQVVEAVQPPRSLSHTPVFQVMFALQNMPQATLELPGLTLVPQAVVRQAAQFDLSLSLAEAGDQLVGDITYASDLFDRHTIERWVGHLQSVMKAMVRDADQTLGQLGLLSAAERHQVVEGFNATAADYPEDKLIHQLFEAQVARQPQAVALVYEDRQLSYGELNARANRLAHWLRQQGVGPDTLVAICLERGLEMVVALLGILKAGGAYVPLDPAYPPARIAHMLDDAGPAVLITQASLLDILPHTRARILALDRDQHLIAPNPDTNPDPAALGLTPHHLAYVIYTSGSTGTPKGVMVEHRNVARLFAATENWFHFDHRDVWTLFHSFAFDFSVWEIWGALLYGGRLVVVPYLIARSPQDFYRLLCDEKVSVLNSDPDSVCATHCGPAKNRAGAGATAGDLWWGSAGFAYSAAMGGEQFNRQTTARQHVRHYRNNGTCHLPTPVRRRY